MHESSRRRGLFVVLLGLAAACVMGQAHADCIKGSANVRVNNHRIRVFSGNELSFSVAPLDGLTLTSVVVRVNADREYPITRLPPPAADGWRDFNFPYRVGDPRAGDDPSPVDPIQLPEEDSSVLSIRLNFSDGSCQLSANYPVQTGSTGTFAVLVGINEYPHANAKLSFARQDAESIAKLLLDNFPNAVKRQNIYLLTDPWSDAGTDPYLDVRNEATRQNILDALSDVYSHIDSRGRFVFYFSGHGFASTDPIFVKEDYILTRDSVTDRDTQMISMEDIAVRMDKTPADEKLLILDACFSDRFVIGLPNGATESLNGGRGRALSATIANEGIARLIPGKNVYVLTAGTEKDLSYEVDKLSHGLLTNSLLTAADLATRSAGDINMHALYKYATDDIKAQLNKYMPGKQQRPHQYVFGRGDEIIWLRQLGVR